MARHYEESKTFEKEHSVAISLVDLSVWCFACDTCMSGRFIVEDA